MIPEIRALLRTYLEHMADYQSSALLTIVYWSAMAIPSVIMKILGKRLLPARASGSSTYWHDRPRDRADLKALSKQF